METSDSSFYPQCNCENTACGKGKQRGEEKFNLEGERRIRKEKPVVSEKEPPGRKQESRRDGGACDRFVIADLV